MHPRDLLQQYFEAIIIHEPAGDIPTMLGIGKQIALCHIFSEICNDNRNTRDVKWEFFKHCWEATQGPQSLLNIIELVYFTEPGYKTPVKVLSSTLHELDWSAIWSLVNFVGNIVEDYARANLVGEESPPKLAWLQTPRKYEGAFFTPPPLARFIAGRIQKNWTQPWTDTRIFDPSVGCGHFLLALAEIYSKQVKNLDQEEFQHFLRNNLFGGDQDIGAVTTTALLLALVGGDWSLISAIRRNINHADTLLMDGRDQYHIVVGNPPWGCVRKRTRNAYALKFPMCNDFENFEYFSVHGLEATIPGGLHAFVVPNTFFRNILSVKFRKWYTTRAQFIENHDFSSTAIFSEPKVRSCVFIAKKNPCTEPFTKIFIHTNRDLTDPITVNELPPDWFQNNIEMWHLSYVPASLLDGVYKPILTQSQPLGSYTETKQGFIPYRYTTLAKRLVDRFRNFTAQNLQNKDQLERCLQGAWPPVVPLPNIPIPTIKTYSTVGNDLARRIVKERLWHQYQMNGSTMIPGYFPLIKGRDVRAFEINWQGNSFAYGKHVSSFVEERFFTMPRLLFPEINGPFPYCVQAAYTTENFVHDPQIINAVFRDNLPPEWHWFCLAAANSLPVSAFMTITSPKTGKGLFDKLLIKDVRRIPIPLSPKLLQEGNISLTESHKPLDLQKIEQLIRSKTLPPNEGIAVGIDIARELVRINKVKELRGELLKKLREFNDILFCRLYGVEYQACLQATSLFREHPQS